MIDRIQKLVSSTHHHHGVSQRPHTPDQDRHQSSEFAGGGRLEELGEHYGMNDANVFQSKATNTTLFVVDILPRGVLSTEIHDQASSAACVSSSSSLLSSSSPSSSSPIIGSESNPNPPHTQARDHRHRQLEKQKEVLDTFKLYTHLSEQRVKQQRSAMRKLYLQMQEKVEWNNGKHEQLLRRLWCLSRPDIDFPGHVSERWKDIGFQGR